MLTFDIEISMAISSNTTDVVGTLSIFMNLKLCSEVCQPLQGYKLTTFCAAKLTKIYQKCLNKKWTKYC